MSRASSNACILSRGTRLCVANEKSRRKVGQARSILAVRGGLSSDGAPRLFDVTASGYYGSARGHETFRDSRRTPADGRRQSSNLEFLRSIHARQPHIRGVSSRLRRRENCPRLSRTLRRHFDARRSLPADRSRHLVVSFRERGGGREDRPLQLPGRRSILTDRSLWPEG